MSDPPLPGREPTLARILCVDDEPGVLSALQRLLKRESYQTLVASTGLEALRCLEREQVDLLISDLHMPAMDGIDLLSEARQRWPGIPRILMTGHSDPAATVAAVNEGGIYRYVAKPWDEHDLLQTVHNGLENRFLVAERLRLETLTQEQNRNLLTLNSSLEAKVRERTAELETEHQRLLAANEKLKAGFALSVRVFSSLIELSDERVAGHSRRVAELARRLAAKLGLDRVQVQDLLIASLLHDVGKVGLPATVTGKSPATMDLSELEVYRTHPQRGAMVLMTVEELRPAGRLIRAHHERYDGLGFPDGLSGKAIPLGARILAAANDYDSLQLGLLQGEPMSEDEACDSIIAGRGKRYDPDVIDALKSLMTGRSLPRLDDEGMVLRESALRPDRLEPGMVLSRDLISGDGLLQLTEKYVLDEEMIRIVREMASNCGQEVIVHVDADTIR